MFAHNTIGCDDESVELMSAPLAHSVSVTNDENGNSDETVEVHVKGNLAVCLHTVDESTSVTNLTTLSPVSNENLQWSLHGPPCLVGVHPFL